MALKLLQEALLLSKLSDNKKRTLTVLESAIGKHAARKLVESYQVVESDYDKWLDVIRGFAKTEGLNIKTKNVFTEVAGGVLENDPAPIDQDMQTAIINVLWAKFKAQLTHGKVEKVARAKEEEEQLNFALKRMKGGCEENEEQVGKAVKAPFDPEYANWVQREYKKSQRRNVLYTKPDEFGDYDTDAEDEAYGEREKARRFANRFNPEEDEELNPPNMSDWDDELDDEESEKMGSALNKLSKHSIAELEPPAIPGRFNPDDFNDEEYEDEESEFSQLFRQSQGMEDEEMDDLEDADFDEDIDPPKRGRTYSRDEELEPPTPGDEDSDFDEESIEPPSIPGRFDPNEMDDEDEYSPNDYGDDDIRGRRWDQEDEESADEYEDNRGYGNEDFELPYNNKYDDLDDEDREIIHKGSRNKKDRDLEDFDSANDEGMDQDVDITSKHGHDSEYFDSNDEEYEHESAGNGSYLKPKRSFRDTIEDEELADKGSRFKKGQIVVCKKDGKHYKVEIPPAADDSGDYTGVIDSGRIRMILTKDLEAVQQSEDEESTSKQSSKASFLHDLLTGSKTAANIKQLQTEIENEAANTWTIHHSKMQPNPHEKGSIAYKAWERGIKQAASAVWAPKPVVVDPKVKSKKKK